MELASRKTPKVYRNPLELARLCTFFPQSPDVGRLPVHSEVPGGQYIPGSRHTDRPLLKGSLCWTYARGFDVSDRFPAGKPPMYDSLSSIKHANASPRGFRFPKRSAGSYVPAIAQSGRFPSRFPSGYLRILPNRLFRSHAPIALLHRCSSPKPIRRWYPDPAGRPAGRRSMHLFSENMRRRAEVS